MEAPKPPWENGHFWITVWFLLNVGFAVANKSVFHFSNFSYPLTLTIGHMTATSAFSAVFVWMGWSKPPEEQVLSTPKKWLMGLLFWANIAVGNLSLQLSSIALSQVVRSLIPGITMLLSYFILAKRYSSSTVSAVSLVIVGVVMTTYSDAEATIFALMVLLIGSFLSSLKVVMVGKYIGKIDPIYLLYIMAPISVFQMIIYGFLTGEFSEIHYRWAELNNAPNWVLVSSTSVMAFFLNYSNFMTNKLLSPLTLTVAGNLKQVVTIVIGIAIFKTKVELLMGTGIAVTVLGCVVYSRSSMNEKKKEKEKDRELIKEQDAAEKDPPV